MSSAYGVVGSPLSPVEAVVPFALPILDRPKNAVIQKMALAPSIAPVRSKTRWPVASPVMVVRLTGSESFLRNPLGLASKISTVFASSFVDVCFL